MDFGCETVRVLDGRVWGTGGEAVGEVLELRVLVGALEWRKFGDISGAGGWRT